jgi:arabinofuranosyltransferase
MDESFEITRPPIISKEKPERKAARLAGLLLGASILLFFVIQLKRAWVSDDAFITFRTIDNFLNGYGLVWNIGERVQTYTHPLWMLVLSAASFLTHDLVFTSIFISIALTSAAIFLLVKFIAVSRLSALFMVIVLILSNAFVDYSTSGLENPLSHILLIIFFTIYYTKKPSIGKIFWLSFVASLGALNRLDLALIFTPVLLYALIETKQAKGILAMIAGFIPLLLWEIFSIGYYGFPFPNTAYAKLNTGIPAVDLALQGIAYIKDSLLVDPITLVMIGSGVLLAFLSKEKRNIPIAIGVLLYLLYILKIGGDFMSGRFLAAPLLCSLVIIARYDLTSLPPFQTSLLFATVIVLGLISPTPTLNLWEADLTPKQRSAMVNDSKVSNERRFYGWSTSLMRINPTSRVPDHPYAQAGLQAQENGTDIIRRITVGMFGYYAGPSVYIVDELALGDALLARLPATRDDRWRIGHFQRTIPDGYLETLESGENVLADANLAQFYDQLALITRGGLLSPERLAAIWKMNTGRFVSLIDFDTYRYPKLIQVSQAQVSQPRQTETAWDEPGNTTFQDSGIEIDMGNLVSPSQIELSLDGNNAYQIVYLNHGRQIAQQKLSRLSSQPGMKISCLTVPPRVKPNGFDKIRIFSVQGDENYSLGYLSLKNCAGS